MRNHFRLKPLQAWNLTRCQVNNVFQMQGQYLKGNIKSSFLTTVTLKTTGEEYARLSHLGAFKLSQGGIQQASANHIGLIRARIERGWSQLMNQQRKSAALYIEADFTYMTQLKVIATAA